MNRKNSFGPNIEDRFLNWGTVSKLKSNVFMGQDTPMAPAFPIVGAKKFERDTLNAVLSPYDHSESSGSNWLGQTQPPSTKAIDLAEAAFPCVVYRPATGTCWLPDKNGQTWWKKTTQTDCKLFATVKRVKTIQEQQSMKLREAVDFVGYLTPTSNAVICDAKQLTQISLGQEKHANLNCVAFSLVISPWNFPLAIFFHRPNRGGQLVLVTP